MNSHQKNLLRKEGFLLGFVAARDPKKPGDAISVLKEADQAWNTHLARQEAMERG